MNATEKRSRGEGAKKRRTSDVQVIEEGGKKRRDARRLPLHVQMGAGATHVCPQTEGVTAWSQPKCRCSVGQVLNILEEGEVRSKQAHGVDKAAGEVRCKQGLEVHLGPDTQLKVIS